MFRLLCGCLLLVVCALPVGDVHAQARNDGPAGSKQTDQEAEALAFARLHHSELRGLLDRLKKHSPREFDQAVRHLAQTSERLERLRQRDPERYRVDLEFWKVDSRIRLLAAQLAMTNDPALEEQIRDLLRERGQLRLHQLRLERDRLANRLQKVNDTIATLDADRETAVEREFERLTKSVSASSEKLATPRDRGAATSVKQPAKKDRAARDRNEIK